MTFGGPKWLLGDKNVFLGTKMTFWCPICLFGDHNDFRDPNWLLGDQKVLSKLYQKYVKTRASLFLITFSRVLLLLLNTFPRILPLPYHLFHLLQDALPPFQRYSLCIATFSRPYVSKHFICQIVQHPKTFYTYINSNSRETFLVKGGVWGGKRSKSPKVQWSQGPRYLKVTFKYELDSKEGPSC